MKSGTGEDPFADDLEPEQDQQNDPESSPETEDTAPDTSTNEPSGDDESVRTEETEEKEETEAIDENDTGDGIDQDDIPWILRRSRVKDGRPEMIPVYVREETADAEAEFVRSVEDAVGKDVYKFDVREAAMLVAMNHPEEVADQLNDWGYKFLD
jgi:hypothetical protein